MSFAEGKEEQVKVLTRGRRARQSCAHTAPLASGQLRACQASPEGVRAPGPGCS